MNPKASEQSQLNDCDAREENDPCWDLLFSKMLSANFEAIETLGENKEKIRWPETHSFPSRSKNRVLKCLFKVLESM